MFWTEIRFGHLSSHSPSFVQFPKPASSIALTSA